MFSKLNTAMVAATASLTVAMPHVPRSCGADFKNVVFNGGVNNEPDPVGRWGTIQAKGVSSWIGFTAEDASPADPNFVGHQIKMVVTGDNVQRGLDIATAGSAPYLQLLNEPDGGFYGQPVYSAQQASDMLQPFFALNTGTKLLSPAPAYPDSPWLGDFFNACGGCIDKFYAVLAHVYNPDPNAAIATMQNLINQYPGKPIWITEISPASNADMGCNLDQQGMIDWMNQVIGWAAQQPQIERVFWNCGEYGALDSNNPGNCNPSLTVADSIAGTPLLDAFGAICA